MTTSTVSGCVVCLTWLVLSVFLYVLLIVYCRRLIMVSGWICRHSHVHMSHRKSTSGWNPSAMKRCVSQALPNCSWQLATLFKCSCSLSHVRSYLPFCTFTQEHYSTSYINSLVPVCPLCLEVNRHLPQLCHMCSVAPRCEIRSLLGLLVL